MKSSVVSLAAVATLFGSTGLAADPRAYFELSTLSGAGNTVTLYRVPVTTGTGSVVYKDVVIQFQVGTGGSLAVAAGSPVITPSKQTSTGNFVPGLYFMTYNSQKYQYRLSGPGTTTDGRTAWSIQSKDGACDFSAGWTTGPIAGHPQQARLKAAGITFAGYSYGTMGKANCVAWPDDFNPGDLIGVAATSGGLTVYNYTDGSGDHSTPVSSGTFTLCSATGC